MDYRRKRLGGNVSMQEIVHELISHITSIPNEERPYLVAIDGLSGAGKTTFVKKLDHELKNQKYQTFIFHTDNHIVEKNSRYLTGNEEWYEYYYLQWDVNLLTSILFERLHQNCRMLNLPFYDKENDDHSIKPVMIEPESVVLIEGIFLQRKEWRNFFDFTIFIDCPRNVRFERVLKRDQYIGDYEAIQSKYKRRYWPGEDYYVSTVSPKERANIVIQSVNT